MSPVTRLTGSGGIARQTLQVHGMVQVRGWLGEGRERMNPHLTQATGPGNHHQTAIGSNY